MVFGKQNRTREVLWLTGEFLFASMLAISTLPPAGFLNFKPPFVKFWWPTDDRWLWWDFTICVCVHTNQKRAFHRSRRRPAALWPGWPVPGAGTDPPPEGPTAEWSPRTARPAWGRACSRTGAHTAQSPPTFDQRSLKHKKTWWYRTSKCEI